MSRQLHKGTLKVLAFDFLEGREALEALKENKKRRYVTEPAIAYDIITNQGTLHVRTEPRFEFDGRSGPAIVDWYAPNLGTLEEKLCWHAHDCNAYGLDLSFEDTNTLLYVMLRDLPKYKPSKANLIQLAVSLSRSWYGEPKPGDWCCCNKGKVSTVWTKR